MEHQVVNPYLMYALGYIGLFARIVWVSLKHGTEISAMFHYVKKNSLVILSSFLAYNGVCALWMWTDMFAAGGMYQGELSAMTVILGAAADSIFKKAVQAKKGELLDVISKRGGKDAPTP